MQYVHTCAWTILYINIILNYASSFFCRVVTYFNPIDAVRAANMTNGQLIFNDMPPVDVMLDEVKPPAYMENSFYPPHPYQQW